MNTANQNDLQTSIDLRIRTMRTVWIGLLGSIGAYYVFTLFGEPGDRSNPNLSLTLICIGMVIVPVTFLIKSKLLSKATEQQNTGMVQQAYVVTWTINDASALLGVFDYFLTGNRYYYVLLIIAALGLLLHFPRREHVVNAAFRGSLM